MTREEIDEQTREDWRELGFFYDFDKTSCCWRLVGSRQGLLRFCEILNEYTNDVRKKPISEHEHYGPYWYLKLVTWNVPAITQQDIRGRFEDFRELAKLTKAKLENAAFGDKFAIDKEYSQENEAKLLFEVKEDDFDPAKADPLL